VALGLKAASRTTVPLQGFDGMVKRSLHLRMVLVVFQFFARDPLCGGHE